MAETWKGVPVKTDLLPIGTRRYGTKMDGGKAKFIVAHDTGNANSTAQQNVNYYKNTYNIDINQTASAHIFVDDKEAIVCVPTNEKAWHVLYNATTDNLWYGVDANDAAIGVEICYFVDKDNPKEAKERTQKSLDNGAKVLAYLCEFWGINYKTEMPGHQNIQSDKQDPGNVLEAAGYGRATSNLDKIVAKYYKIQTKVTKTVPDAKTSKAKLTQKQFVDWLKQSIGKKYDFDHWYGNQCYDYANAGWSQLFSGNPLQGLSAKNIHIDNKAMLSTRATTHKNTPTFLAQPGDMVIFPNTFGEGHGHVAWVIESTLNQITVVEQNWLGGGWTYGPEQGGSGWETATQRIHSYDPNMVFIRPNFASNKVTAALRNTKDKVAKPKTKWNWKGRFTTNSVIKVRRSPGLKGSLVDKGSWLLKDQWVDFVSIEKKDGYWWAKFKYPTNPSAGYFYCAIARITDKQERIKYEKELFGTIKYK